MSQIEQAKTAFKAEKSKVLGSLSALLGSRWLLAILATFAIAFGTHLAFAPTRLPPVGGLSLSQAGLPPGIDFGVAGEKAAEAREAAQRQGAPDAARAWIDGNRERIPLVNTVGLGLTLLLLGVNLFVTTRRRRETRG
jgi:hypothetical protein